MTRPWSRRWSRPPRHVADVIIADGREPTADETRHLETCPACFAAVRRSRSFDRLLVEAAAGLSSSPLAPEVLTVPMPSIRRPPAPSLTSFGVIAALIVAGGLVAWSALPRGDVGASPRPTATPDPHLVVVDGATWRISLAGRSIEIHRSSGTPGTSEDLLVSWDVGEFINGGASTNLRCPRPDGGEQWATFGHQNSSERLSYSGPPATGQWAPDGLWLWVLDMSRFEPSTPIELKGPDGRVVAGTGTPVERTTDVREPSGCFISG